MTAEGLRYELLAMPDKAEMDATSLEAADVTRLARLHAASPRPTALGWQNVVKCAD